MEIEKISNLEQIAYIKRIKTDSGMDMLACKYKRLEFSLNVCQALDIYDLSFCGDNIAFISKNGLKRQSVSEDFDGRFVGGFLFTAGLENIGRSESAVTHGSLCACFANIIAAKAAAEGLTIEAEMRQSALFGDNLVMNRRYVVSENYVEITDSVLNEGYKQAGFMLLHHINFGYPFLDAGTEVGDFHIMQNPSAENIESVEFRRLKSVSIYNPKLNRRVEVCHDMPCLATWISEVSGDYALGIEPATTEFKGKKYTVLNVGEKRVFTTRIKFE